ncbi:hypothetical protein [Moraxella boevrei]|uniref:hypothetical protein n=1 Tax=Faucicola boevrei TaxID=346665 RepID=UPI003734D6D3
MDSVTDVEVNGLRVYSYSSDFTPIMADLLALQSNIKPRHFFIDDNQWIDYYLSYLQMIFAKISGYDDWVSHDFHVYLQYGDDGRRYFGHVANDK